MWVFFNFGYFSVVAHRDDKKLLMIRSRIKGDLEKLKKTYLSNLGDVVYTPKADYPYRALAWKSEFAEAVKKAVLDIDYENFKSSVSKEQGHPRHDLYMSVWSAMRRADPDMGFKYPESYYRKYTPVQTTFGSYWNTDNEVKKKGRKHKKNQNESKDDSFWPDGDKASAFSASGQTPVVGSTWTDGVSCVTLTNWWDKDGDTYVSYETDLCSRIDVRYTEFLKQYWREDRRESINAGKSVRASRVKGSSRDDDDDDDEIPISPREMARRLDALVISQMTGTKDDFNIDSETKESLVVEED